MPTAKPRRRARQSRHRRRRRYPLVLLGGLTIVVAGALALVLGLSPAQNEPDRTATDDTALSAPDATSDPDSDASPKEEETPVLRRSVVDEADSASGDMDVVKGQSEADGGGTTMTYAVEVEKGLPGEPADFADAVDLILGDERGWAGDGDRSFARVESRDEADFTVTLAAPETVDSLCAPLRTNGYVSCTTGQRAIINQNRWVSGVKHFDGDLETYRVYVVNHEVGHVLGHGHVECPQSGEPAPIMQQQTFGLDGCEPNGWVHP